MHLSARQKIGFYNHLLKVMRKNDHRALENTLRAYIPDDAIVVDVGGHAGQFTKLFARLCPRGRVFVFEPSLYARSILSIMAGLKFLPNVYVLPFGLSNKPETATIHTPLKKGRGVGFGLAFIGDAEQAGRAVVSHTILLSTLDATVQALNLDRLDFIKVDIEGYEPFFLEGAREALNRFKPAVMMEIHAPNLERHTYKPADIFNVFKQAGYTRIMQLNEKTGAQTPLSYDTAMTLNTGDFLFTQD